MTALGASAALSALIEAERERRGAHGADGQAFLAGMAYLAELLEATGLLTGACPTPCAPDCLEACHETHRPPVRRTHDLTDCPGAARSEHDRDVRAQIRSDTLLEAAGIAEGIQDGESREYDLACRQVAAALTSAARVTPTAAV